jgi:uroporphyrinogen decarboxylase
MFFTPAVYEHAASLINRSPWQVSRSADLLLQAHSKAYEIYQHAPVVVGIDIYNLEAEAYGSVVGEPADNAIPVISAPLCSSIAEIVEIALFEPGRDGRIPMVLEVGQCLKEKLPEADVRIPVSGPFSIASNLLGFDSLLLEAFMYPEQTGLALQRLVQGQILFCQEIVNNGLDIAFFESAATPPLISPDMFATVEYPALQSLLEKAESIVAHPVPCIIGGDTVPILEMILQTGTRYVICPAETDQQSFMQKMTDYPDVMVRVNMKSNCIVSEDVQEVYAEIDRLLQIIDGRARNYDF